MIKKECSKKSKHYNNPSYICNPQSGRYVKKDGKIGREISNKIKSIKRKRSLKRRSSNRVNIEMSVNSLETNGYAVIPVYWMTEKNRKEVRKEMLETMNKFPEYIHNKRRVYVMGGFSALCNPSSFHNKFVRKMRMYAMSELVPFFSEYIKKIGGNGWKLEQVIDRMLYRPKGISATAESWHRDEAALALEDDRIFGGWWNFDDYDQYLSCVPGTHKGIRGHTGFAPIRNKEEIKEYNKNKIALRIPPGHIMIFYEHLVHEVLAKKSKQDMHRLFLGWRVTRSKESLYPIESRLTDQAVMPLKSNQIPPMYATLHWTNWRNKILEFSEGFRLECIESKRVKNGKDKGKTYDIVHRHMWSLKDYGFDMYPTYRKEEISMYKPNTQWKLISHIGTKGRKKFKHFNLYV